MAILRTYSAAVETLQPLARYRFNEPDGDVAIDRAGGLNGTYHGSPQLVPGFIGDGAARLDGGDFVEIIGATGRSGSVTIAAFGDSLANGFGVAVGDAFPNQLQAALVAQGPDATVLNRGINDQTTGGALARVADVVAEAPDVVVIVLGTNDARTQVPLEVVESNLRSMIEAFQGAGIQVVLTGTFGFFPGFGGYASEAERAAFEQLFPDLAQEYGLSFTHFFGGARSGEVIQGGVIGDGQTVDGLHPNVAGVGRIVENLLPHVDAALDASGAVQPSDDALALPEGAIEMWFVPTALDGVQALFSKDAPGTGAGQVRAMVDNGRVAVTFEAGSGVSLLQSAPSTVAAGERTHLAFVFGAAGIALFVHGELVAQDTSAAGGVAGNTQPLLIGRAQTGGIADFDGVIDEVLIYGQPLTAAEVAALHQAGLNGSTLVGTPGRDELIGGSDHDGIRGLGGNDVIHGGEGNDDLRGGAGADRIFGGPGSDAIAGGSGRDELHGGAGDDTIWGKDGADVLYGGQGDDVLEGNAGPDILHGGAGDDQLLGGLGNDRLFGGDGNDLLDGGAGRDILNGGPGADMFRIARIDHGIDKVQDFTPADGDVLDLAALLDGFLPGAADPTDFVRLTEVNGNTKLAVDPAGAGGAGTVVLNLLGVTGLSVAELVDDGSLLLG